jgi:hypothetical protein
MMVDGVLGYPNMGDLIGGGGIGSSAFVAYVYKILRGTFNGIVLDANAKPVSGDSVTSTEGSVATGSGTTDSSGGYTLNSPGSLTSGDNLNVNGTQVAHSIVWIRQDRRVGLAPGVGCIASGPVWQVQDDYGRLHLAWVCGGDLQYWRSNTSTGLPLFQVKEQVTHTGDVIYGKMTILPRSRTVYLTFQRNIAGTVSAWTCQSDDDGASFNAPVLFVN